MLSQRDKLNVDIQRILDAATDAWGIKVANVEIKHVDLDETMIRAMAKQAEAERTRRAKIIHAEGEKQAAAATGRGGPARWARNPRRCSCATCRRSRTSPARRRRRSSSRCRIDLIKPFLDAQVARRGGPASQAPAALRAGERELALEPLGRDRQQRLQVLREQRQPELLDHPAQPFELGAGPSGSAARCRACGSAASYGATWACSLRSRCDVAARRCAPARRGPHVLRQLCEQARRRRAHPARREQRRRADAAARPRRREHRRRQRAQRGAHLLERQQHARTARATSSPRSTMSPARRARAGARTPPREPAAAPDFVEAADGIGHRPVGDLAEQLACRSPAAAASSASSRSRGAVAARTSSCCCGQRQRREPHHACCASRSRRSLRREQAQPHRSYRRPRCPGTCAASRPPLRHADFGRQVAEVPAPHAVALPAVRLSGPRRTHRTAPRSSWRSASRSRPRRSSLCRARRARAR